MQTWSHLADVALARGVAASRLAWWRPGKRDLFPGRSRRWNMAWPTRWSSVPADLWPFTCGEVQWKSSGWPWPVCCLMLHGGERRGSGNTAWARHTGSAGTVPTGHAGLGSILRYCALLFSEESCAWCSNAWDLINSWKKLVFMVIPLEIIIVIIDFAKMYV